MAGTYAYGLAGAGPHAVSQVGAKLYSYDANGAMVSGDGKTTTWTSFNKPKEIVDTLTTDKSWFVYGPSRARVKHQTIVNSVITNVVYIGSHFEKKIHPGDDDEYVHYIRAGGAVVAIYTEYWDETDTKVDDKTRYLHRDHLGSVDTATDETGAVTERFSYDAHGKRRETDWTPALTAISGDETPRGFTGHEHLDSVGLIHMNGRVYDPTLGRFLSADPYVQYPETTQGFNRYSYTDNNPLSYTDPSGFSIFNDDGSIAEAPSDAAGPDAGKDDRGFVERVDDWLSGLLGVTDLEARNYARENKVDWHTALDQYNISGAATSAAIQTWLGEYPPKMGQFVEEVKQAMGTLGVPSNMTAAVAAMAQSMYERIKDAGTIPGSKEPNAIGFVGGFGDEEISGIVKQAYERFKERYPALEVDYFTWDASEDLKGWVEAHRGMVTVIGHSWGADTAADIAAGGTYIDRLVTLDPVSRSIPDLEAVAMNTGSWTNVNAVGNDDMITETIAGIGRPWGTMPSGIADVHLNLDWVGHGSVVAIAEGLRPRR